MVNNLAIIMTEAMRKNYQNHDDVTFADVFTRQTCSFTSGEQYRKVRASLQYFSSVKSCHTFYLYQRIAAPAIWIKFSSIVQ